MRDNSIFQLALVHSEICKTSVGNGGNLRTHGLTFCHCDNGHSLYSLLSIYSSAGSWISNVAQPLILEAIPLLLSYAFYEQTCLLNRLWVPVHLNRRRTHPRGYWKNIYYIEQPHAYFFLFLNTLGCELSYDHYLYFMYTYIPMILSAR